MNNIGFCEKCDLIREDDAEGNVTDCRCTARMRHEANCRYLQSVSCPIDVGYQCVQHKQDVCEECECTCGERVAKPQERKQ